MKGQKLTDIKGLTTPDHITLRINRKDLKQFPKTFFIDFTIDDVRDATPREKERRR